ncbi:MAG TPA: adenylate/guanylate cyclase domain-containing protein [Leptolyngbyaceae cyanobacterium]
MSLLLVFILPFVIVVNQLISEINIGIEFAKKERLGLEYIYPLRKLLEHSIQHRTLANANFSNDLDFPENLKIYQSHIEAEIKIIDRLDSRLGSRLNTSQDWRILKRRWQDIKERFTTLSVQERWDLHSLLIAEILYLINHVRDASNLIFDPMMDSYYLMDTAINNLPKTIVNTASARDLGINIILKQKLTNNEKLQSIIISSLIKSSVDKIDQALAIAFARNPSLSPALQNYQQQCLEDSKAFIELMNQKVIFVQDITIEPTEYYAVGTEAIAAQFKLYDAVAPALNELLQIRIARLRQKKLLIAIFALFVSVISIYVFIAFARNLQKRYQAEKALQETEAKYRQIFENALEGIFQTTPEGKYISANQALASIYGYDSPAEIISQVSNIKEQLYVNPKRRDRFVAVLEKESTVSNFVSQVYRRDRTTIWVSENARAVRDRDGKLLYYEGTVKDVTQRKLVEEALRYQQEQSERLLLNILPAPIAARLKMEETTIADSFEEVTVLFADLVDFTKLSSQISPTELVTLLNQIFSEFDNLADEHNLEKIKTIGDAYMVVGGVPTHRSDHAEAVADMALDMQTAIANFNAKNSQSFSIRIGINTGPVVAGVIGVKKFIYDLWGDAVNTASRMESQGIPDTIQVTATTYNLLKDKYEFEERGVIYVKGKGDMFTYLLLGKKIFNS